MGCISITMGCLHLRGDEGYVWGGPSFSIHVPVCCLLPYSLAPYFLFPSLSLHMQRKKSAFLTFRHSRYPAPYWSIRGSPMLSLWSHLMLSRRSSHRK